MLRWNPSKNRIPPIFREVRLRKAGDAVGKFVFLGAWELRTGLKGERHQSPLVGVRDWRAGWGVPPAGMASREGAKQEVRQSVRSSEQEAGSELHERKLQAQLLHTQKVPFAVRGGPSILYACGPHPAWFLRQSSGITTGHSLQIPHGKKSGPANQREAGGATPLERHALTHTQRDCDWLSFSVPALLPNSALPQEVVYLHAACPPVTRIFHVSSAVMTVLGCQQKQQTARERLTMALWKQVQLLPTQTLSELYPSSFPIDVRHYLASWIEEQRWEEFDLEDPSGEPAALDLLEKITAYLTSLAQHNPDVVEKMRLQQVVRNMSAFRSQPLQLVATVQDILKKERALLNQNPQCPPAASSLPGGAPVSASAAQGSKGALREERRRELDQLVVRVLDIQKCRQKIHQLQEELNWDRQNCESMQAQVQQNKKSGSDPKLAESCTNLQNRIQQLEFNCQGLAKQRLQFLQEGVSSLDQCQAHLLLWLRAWRREQHLATIGAPFDDNLAPLQTWCEQLLGVNMQLSQEVIIASRDSGPEPFRELQERLSLLLKTLIQSSMLVDKQPHQVIKTQSKFSTTVRYLLGEKVSSGKPAVVKAQIITEAQARNLGQPGSLLQENVGELINNSAILDHNASTKSTCATFRNMSIKKIKRADRKGSESVTEEKFALLFSCEISITGCDTPYSVQVISLPIVVIVHGSQDNNALATIIWDCAFSEPDRVPFVVPERVPWKQMCMTLNSKFMSEVQTQRGLDSYNLHFLAQKIFDKHDINGDFSNQLVSWAQFNKEVLPGRAFTFWQWFDGVMELTKKHLKSYWSDGLIFGFIGKQHLHLILQDRPNGTFLLRFSDSEIGGITIAYVTPTDGARSSGPSQEFRGPDRMTAFFRDLTQNPPGLPGVCPTSKASASPTPGYLQTAPSVGEDEQPSRHNGYIGVSIQTKVAGGDESPPTNMGNGGGHPALSPVRSDTPQDAMGMQHPFPGSHSFSSLMDSSLGNGGMVPSPHHSDTSMDASQPIFYPHQQFQPSYGAASDAMMMSYSDLGAVQLPQGMGLFSSPDPLTVSP
ncbi:STA5B protein, partial [Atractosteus spatula]|nr:STA5B protein [Atractosteus spatula]